MNFLTFLKENRDNNKTSILAPFFIFILALALRLTYVTQLNRTVLNGCLQVDPEYYHKWAMRISKGDFMGKEIFEMTPLYAYFLAFIYKFFTTDLFLVRCVQALIGSGSALLVYLITYEFFQKKRAALLGGTLAAMYGPFIFFDGMIMKPFLALFFILLTAYALIKSEKGSFLSSFLAGLSLALTALARENVILLIPIIPLWFLTAFRTTPLKIRYAKAGAFLIGVIIVISPVTIRNYIVGKEFVLITSGGGEVFYMANNLEADGTYSPPGFVRPNPSFEHEDFRKKAEELTGRTLSRKESSSFWFDEGIRYILENPIHFTKLVGKKFALFWNYYEYPDNRNYYFQQLLTPILGSPLLTFGALAPFGFLGMLLSFREFKRLSVIHILFLTYLFSFLIFYNFSRFRVPSIPFIIFFAVYAIFWIIDQFQHGKKINATAVLLCSPVLYFLFHIDISVQDPFQSRFDTAYANLGLCYEKEFQDRKALASYKKTLEINPAFPLALSGSGNVYFRQGKIEAAKNAYQKALKYNQESFLAQNGMGNVYLTQHKPREALDSYRKALKMVPKSPLYLSNVGFTLNSLGLYQEAIVQHNKAVQHDPEYAIGYFGLAKAYEKKGNSSDAIKNYTIFIQKSQDPNWIAKAKYKIKLLQAL